MPTSGARLGPTLQCCEEAGFVIWVLWCTTLGLDIVSMPSFKRKPFPQVQPPQDLNPDDPVFQVRFTKEIFRDYHLCFLAEYLQQVVHGAIPSTYFESETAVPDAEMSVHILNHLYQQLDEVCPVRGGGSIPYASGVICRKFPENIPRHSLMGCAPSMASG